MRRWIGLATAVALVATFGARSAAAQSSTEEGRFVELINQLRTAKGVPALTIDGALAATSCAWTDHMVAVDTLAHDPNLATQISSVEAGWTKGGENVGVGGDVDLLFDAFVASPAHYRNLVDPAFNAIGVCVTWTADHNRMYTTHRFVANGQSPATPATTVAVAIAPTTALATTAPPTTAAPTTSTEPPTTTTVPPTTVPAAIPVDALVPVASNALTAGVLVAIAESTR